MAHFLLDDSLRPPGPAAREAASEPPRAHARLLLRACELPPVVRVLAARDSAARAGMLRRKPFWRPPASPTAPLANSHGSNTAPLGALETPAPADHASPPAPWPTAPASTFLVDDSPSFLQSATRFLAADERIEIVGVAQSAHDALAEVERLRPALVLMDLNMPGMNGLEATRRIKAWPNAPRVVILTLHDTEEYRLAARAARADGFLSKSDFGQGLLPLLELILFQDGADAENSLQAPPAARPSAATSASPCAALRSELAPACAIEEPPPAPATSSAHARHPLRVLMAQGPPSASRAVALHLGRVGIEARIAADAGATLQSVKTFQPHLVVVDAASPLLGSPPLRRQIGDASGAPILMSALGGGAWAAPEDAEALAARVLSVLRRFYREAF